MVEYARIITKSSEGAPTIPPSASHDNGDWSPNDIYENELYMDILTGFLYTRQADTIIRLSVDPAGTLVYHDSSMTGDGTLSDPLGLNISTVLGNGLVLTADGLFVNLSGYVPYTGATTDVDLGEHQLKAGQIELDQTPTGAFNVGMIRWNDTDGTAEIRLKGGNVTLQIGQEQIKRVVNKTSPLITLQESAYQAVVVAGAQGQRLAVKLAKADSDANSAGTIGIVTETIAANQEGFITTSGEVRGINTTGSLQGETWTDGDILYLSPTIFGAITNVKPTAPSHLVVIGYVEYAHATQGKIFVKIDNGYELEELHNVTDTNYTTPQDEDSFLFFDETQTIWKRLRLDTLISTLSSSFQSALGFTPENAANKSASVTTDQASNTKYPSVKSVYDWATGLFATIAQLATKENTITAGTTSQYFRGDKTFQALDKTAVGLSNVDNTSDLNKPISTATQTALNGKQNTLSLTTTGTSGAATLVGSTLNIPQYGGGGASGLKGVHTLLPLSFNQSTSAIITTPANLSNVGLTANRLVLYPFIPANSFTAETMFINCTTLLSGANARILIYSDLNGSPNSKLMESTDLSLATTGQKSYVSFFDFVAGTTYWIGVHASTGGSVTHMAASSIMPIYNFGINVYVNYFVNVAFGSAPATITSKTPNTTNTPFIGMIAI